MKRKETRRSVRMGDMVMRELASMVAEEVQDPRLAMVTITGVRLNADLRVAEVLFSAPGGDEQAADALAGLSKAKGFLRTGLGRRLKLKYVPDLRFSRDTFLEDMVYAKRAGDDLPDH